MSFTKRSDESPMEFEYQSQNHISHSLFTPSKVNNSEHKSLYEEECFSTPTKRIPHNNYVFNSSELTATNETEPSIQDNSKQVFSDDINVSRTGVPTETQVIHLTKKNLRKRIKESHKQQRKTSSSDSNGSDLEVFYEHQAKSRKILNHDLPYVLSGWLQLAFNLFLVAITLYIILQFIYTVQRDVDIKVREYSADILQEIEQCSKNYIDNRCTPVENRVPAMEHPCNIWEACMKRDPTVIGRAKVSAETFAEILNNFVEPISYKTMIFFTFLIFGSLFLSNFAFGFLRARALHDYQYYPQDESIHHPSGPWTTPRRISSRYIKSR